MPWETAALATGLLLVLVLTGCSGIALSRLKEQAAQGEYEWIAAQTVECNKASDSCGQRHLIKGDACFLLARAGTAPAGNYACAADALEQGLALNRSWPDPAAHRQLQEKLCESLSALNDRNVGEADGKTLNRFEKAAKSLYQLAPGSVPAIYFMASVRLRKVQPLLAGMTAADRLPACNRLKRALGSVLSMMETAKGTSLPDWDRYADRYQRLSFDLGLAIRVAECR